VRRWLGVRADGGPGSSDQVVAACRPLEETCGGPAGRTCGEGSYCDYAAEYSSGSPCGSFESKRYGICRPLEACEVEAAVPTCGRKLVDGALVITKYANVCAGRATGEPLLSSWECPDDE